MRRKRMIAIVMSAMLVAVQPVWAADMEFSDGTESEMFISGEENALTEGIAQDRASVPEPFLEKAESLQAENSETGEMESTLPEVLTENRLPSGEAGKEYYVKLEAESRNGQVLTWTLAEGQTLPEGLTLTEDGIISGVPVKAGEYTLYLALSNQETEVLCQFSCYIRYPFAEPTPTPIPEKDYELKMDEEFSFGQYPLDYTAGIRSMEIRNTGKKALHVDTVSVPTNFLIDEELVPGMEMEAGESLIIGVELRKNLPWGTYEEDLVITTREGITAKCRMKAVIGPSSEKDYDVTTTPENHSEIHFTEEDFVDDWPHAGIWIQNTGKKAVSVKCSNMKEFEIGYDKEIEPGACVGIDVSPKDSARGEKKETLQISLSGGIKLDYTISQYIEPVPRSYEIVNIEPSELNFGAEAVGYPNAPAPKNVKITNISKETIHLCQNGQTKYFIRTRLGKETLEPGESTSFSVQPKMGIPFTTIGYYSDRIGFYIWNYQGYNVEAGVEAKFNVSPYCIKEIKPVEPVKGLSNGKPKSLWELRIPSRVEVSYEGNDAYPYEWLDVDWDLNGCSYDPDCKEEQNFTVYGVVKLPDEVKNYNNIDLQVSANVQVKAYEHLAKPVIASAHETNGNTISVALYDSINGADGYDFAFGKQKDFLETDRIVARRENQKDYGTILTKIKKGNYYLSCRAYELKNGKKKFSSWADPVYVPVKARRPTPSIIKSVKPYRDTIKFTVEKGSAADGYDAVLAKSYKNGEPLERQYIKGGITKNTFTFKVIRNGTYYLGVRSYNRDNGKCSGDWSKFKKVVIKDGVPTTLPKIKSVKAGTGRVDISVNLPKSYDGYDVVLMNPRVPPEFDYEISSKKTTASFTKVKKAPYRLKLRGWIDVKGRKVYTDWVAWPERFLVK